MDRRILVGLVGLVAACLLAPGCGGPKDSPPKAASATAATGVAGSAAPGASGGPTTSETHRPVIASSEPPDFQPPSLAGAEVASPAAAQPPSDAAPVARSTNPLRIESAAIDPPATASGPNPLRTRSAVPRMAMAPREAAPPETAPLETVPAEAAPPAVTASPAQPEAAQPYEVVEVFYGTDRRAAEALANDWGSRLVRFLPTLCAGLLTLCMALVAAQRRKLAIWTLVFGGVGVTLGLGFQATSRTIAAVRQAGKTGLWYTTERSAGNKIDLGRCEVTIPKTHVSGELEAPSILRLEVREDAAQHVVLRQTERLASEPFYRLLRERVERSPRKELFVFVHGFNVSFEDAARRTAQIHHDLHFEGAPVFFSWPARDKFILTYPADESSVATSAPNLKRFLLEIVKETEARSINLIAHSMGNRALGVALREIDLELRGDSRLFNQVILAAPDIDAEDFRTNIAPAMRRTAQRLTLYASSRDDALLASQLLHRGPRAGDAGAGLVVIPGIDTIDVTAIDSSPWGHSYYGSSDPVLTDLKALFLAATPAHDRTWLSPAELNGHTYWIFQPARTAITPGSPPR